MGIDEKLWIDIHGPKDEIDEIEKFFREGDFISSPSTDEFKQNMNTLDFGPLNGSHFTRKTDRYLYAYCSYTFRGSYPNTSENIEVLSKHFPNTLFRYTTDFNDEGYYDVVIMRHVNGKHVVWSDTWSTWERWHSWPVDAIREFIGKCERTTTTVRCGCEALTIPCEYTSPIYDCGLEVLGVDKTVIELFEKRSVKVNKYRDTLFIRFQYTKDPIQLMEWLSAKYKDCCFVCEYSNTHGTQCVWSNYSAFHYPYIKL